MASAVVECTRLFKPPVASVNLDPTVWAEGCGATVDWASGRPEIVDAGPGDPDPDVVMASARTEAVLHAVERVRGAVPGTPLGVGVPGPATLAGMIGLSDATSSSTQFAIGEVLSEATRALCEAGVDLIVVMEDPALDEPDLRPWIAAGQVGRVMTIAGHYSSEVLLLAAGAEFSAESAEPLAGLDYFVAYDPTPAMNGCLTGRVLEGIGGLGEQDEVDVAAGSRDGAGFTTVAWDLPPTADPAAVLRDIKTLREIS
ncbi:MAG: hypothetical protein ACR2PK_06255 [Acidimicrobiales bacterium]